MNRSGHQTATFFVGTEIEHSPAMGQRTMFVIGLQSVEQILWNIGETDRRSKEPITHVYFGANQSFPNPAVNDAETWNAWEVMIQAVLDRGYWCTLDLDVSAVPGLAEGGLTENAQFIPMISVKLPYIKLLGYNATVKIDDTDFQATNPGVWCHSLHDLMQRQKFTSWNQYTKDEIVK
jgi:hypothetical protein